MRVLYIPLINYSEINGGIMYRRMIGDSLYNIVGKDNLDIFCLEADTTEWKGNIIHRVPALNSVAGKLKNLLVSGLGYWGNSEMILLKELILKGKYKWVVLGCSEAGHVVKYIKKHTSVNTLTCYNDIISDMVSNQIRKGVDIKTNILLRLLKRNEKYDAKHTDSIIVLNERDKNTLLDCYGRKANAVIPLAIQDNYVKENASRRKNKEEPLRLLFVGSYNWYPNREGIKWFCSNVMEKLTDRNILLRIAGFNMEQLRSESDFILPLNTEIAGTVPDISSEYYQTDVVVAPILSGTGMKVKTAEALMYGKTIIGTSEAFEGYPQMEEYICDTAEAFCDCIIRYLNDPPSVYCESNRKIYEEHLSVCSFQQKLLGVLSLS